MLLTGCGAPPPTHYYTLQVSPPPPASDATTRFSLEVGPFRAPAALRDDRIVYYESPTQLNFYQQHRWSDDPSQLMALVVMHWLEHSRCFVRVQSTDSRALTDYVLKGRILNLEEVDYAGGAKARVGLALSLVRSRDRKTVWSATRQAESIVQEKSVASVVGALDAATRQLLDELLPGLVAQVESDSKESATSK